MKTLVPCILLTFFTLQAHSKDLEALADIHKKRKDLLETIVTLSERQYDAGTCTLVDVLDAKVRLNKFQRNRALDWEQKKLFQSRIIELEKSRLTMLKLLHKEGAPGVTILEVMRAEDRHLAARQRGLEIDAQELWKGNRLTPDQPFPAKVIGVAWSWVGYELLLEEIGAEKPRHCYAIVSDSIYLKYTLTTKEASPELTSKWIMLPSGIPVSKFNYSKGGYKLGEKHGADDLLLQAVAIRKSAEQGGARQPATAVDSKSEGKKKPKSESGARSE